MSRRDLRVAGLQVASYNGQARANLDNAAHFVGRAAEQGAELVLCPELLAAGYGYESSIWQAGELRGGLTESWLCEMAARHRIYIGASYLEADGEDFFNTFTLVGPKGDVEGRVRKVSLPSFEGWIFKSSPDAKYIDTDLGRIGVGICNDNNLATFMRDLHAAAPDLVLMPHSAPVLPGMPTLSRVMLEALENIGPFYARNLGVPTLMVNKATTHAAPTRIPGVPLVRLNLDFAGPSVISDAEGRVLGRLGGGEGIVLGDVVLDAGLKRADPPETVGYWSRAPQGLPRVSALIWRAFGHLGARAYERSPSRRRAARMIGERAASVAESVARDVTPRF